MCLCLEERVFFSAEFDQEFWVLMNQSHQKDKNLFSFDFFPVTIKCPLRGRNWSQIMALGYHFTAQKSKVLRGASSQSCAMYRHRLDRLWHLEPLLVDGACVLSACSSHAVLCTSVSVRRTLAGMDSVCSAEPCGYTVFWKKTWISCKHETYRSKDVEK